MNEFELDLLRKPLTKTVIFLTVIVMTCVIAFGQDKIIPVVETPIWHTATGITLIGAVVATLITTAATGVVSIVTALKLTNQASKQEGKLEQIHNLTNSALAAMKAERDAAIGKIADRDEQIAKAAAALVEQARVEAVRLENIRREQTPPSVQNEHLEAIKEITKTLQEETIKVDPTKPLKPK